MQVKPEFTPITGAIAGQSFEDQLIEMLKAGMTLQAGAAKPDFLEDQSIWQKILPDGTSEFYLWTTADGDTDGTKILPVDLSGKADVDLSNVVELSENAIVANTDLSNLSDTALANAGIDYRVIYGTGQKAIFDPDNPKAIEDAALGVNGVVGKNSRYELTNPFPSSQVIVYAEIFYEGLWGDSGKQTFVASNIPYTVGTKGFFFGGKIVIQTGYTAVFRPNNGTQISPFNFSLEDILESINCRVRVWKIGA